MRSAPSHRPTQSAVILLVDDNTDGILARRSVLEELGYSVVTANSGEAALTLVKTHGVDLVITDYKMNPVNGLELIAALRETHAHLPIILLTGFADALGLSPDNTGASIVLQKNASELNSLLRNAKRLLQPPRKPARSNASVKPISKAKGSAR